MPELEDENRYIKVEGVIQDCVYRRSNTVDFKVANHHYFIDTSEYSCAPITNGMFIKGKAIKENWVPKGIQKIIEIDIFDTTGLKRLLCSLSPKDTFGREP